MPRDPHQHLSPEELAHLAEVEASAPHSPDAGSDWQSAGEHAAACDLCGPRLRIVNAAQSRLRNLLAPVKSVRKSECPPETTWLQFAADTFSGVEAADLLEHASGCDYCGQLLKEATVDFSPEFSAEETDQISRLRSASREWQRDLSRRMADLSSPAIKPEYSSPVPPASVRPPTVQWWRKRRIWCAVPAFAVLLISFVAVRTQYSRSSASAANELLARAYAEQRPFLPRISGAGYGALKQRRGGKDSERTSDLLEAEARVARGLIRSPEEPGWLHAKGRADLLEGNYDFAVDALKHAAELKPTNLAIKNDLAMGYFLQGQTDAALQQLNQVLAANPEDSVARFNRALLYEKENANQEAMADWQQFLRLNPSGGWSDEARGHLRMLGTH